MTVRSDAPPLLRFSVAVNDALEKATGVEPLFMNAVEKTQTLELLDAAEQRIRAVKLKVIGSARQGDDVCEAGAHRDVADLMAGRTRQDRAKWSRDEKLAEALEHRWGATRQACLTGSISIEHARVIATVLDDLGDLPQVYAEHLDPETLAKAEAHLIGLAADHNPGTLRKLAAHLFEVIAPAAAEEIEAKKLEFAEQRAEAAMGITIRRNASGVEGLTEIRIRTHDSIADRFTNNLHAFTNPRVHSSDDDDDSTQDPKPLIPFTHPDGQKIPQTRRLAMAFTQLLETLDPSRLPIHGGDATTMIITIGLEELRKDLAAADIGLGEEAGRISAAQTRRLACTANLIPAVLGADSEILDLGRTQRLFTRAQRRAMAIRDQHCRAEGCTIPATWCEAHHHTQPWAQGGKTDLADGKLLCSWHHHRAHDDRYLHHNMPNGDVRFMRRT